MRRLTSPFFCFFSFFFFSLTLDAQVVDTAAVRREVDSLIQLNRDLISKRKFEEAIQVIEQAKTLADQVLGKESAVYATSVFNQGRTYDFMYQYADAESWYLEALAIRERVLGNDHADYAQSLNNLAILYYDMGNYEKAEQLYLEAKDIRYKTLGPSHPDYAESLNGLANLYSDMVDYEKAEHLYLEAKEIREKTLGNNHPDYASSLNNLAILYYDMGNYEKAEPLYLKAKGIKEKTLGKNHPDYVQILNNLAVLYDDMGNYEKAEPLYLETKEIREKTLGKNHPDYAATLNNLAGLYKTKGNYEKAELLHLKSSEIFGKALGMNHPDYTSSLGNLATLYHEMGDYKKAEPLYLEVKEIRAKVLGESHPNYASSLNNLATLYDNMRNYEGAESLYLEAKEIREKALGKSHPDYASSLNSLAILYREMGNYKKAEPLYLEAKEIREKTLGKSHPDYASSLNSLAILYREMGDYKKAEPLCLEAKEIWGKVFGTNHPDYASSLNNLASLYSNMGDYKKAELLFWEAKEIWGKVFGINSSDYAASLNNLSLLYYIMGNYEKTDQYFSEDIQANQSLLIKSSQHLSGRELTYYSREFSEDTEQLLSCISSAEFCSLSLCTLTYSNTLFHKGFLLQTANQTRRLALTDSASTEKYNDLKSYHRRLAAQYALPIAERDSALVAELEEKANTLEKDLVHTVAGYGEALRQVEWQEVRDQLRPGEAAAEFLHYRYYDRKARATDSTMYAALVLLPTDTAPRFVPLCEQRQLDAIFNQKTGNNLYYQNIYNAGDNNASPLYSLLWSPLEPHLQGVKTVYFSPSGLLHRINLGAVQPARRETLADRYQLIGMGSTRNLVVPPAVSIAGNTAALFGGIQYEMDSTKIAAYLPPDTAGGNFVLRGSGGFVYTDSTLRGGAWGPLPATEKEIAAADKILKNKSFQTNVYRDYAATEEALQKIGHAKSPSPRVLHIATHGFFFPDPKITVDGRRSTVDGGEPVFKISDNPMIRSGLLLAGANHAWKTGRPLRPGMEDGILTAYEISQMNLRNTELVVLSACETGLGQIEGNEGVYGLQRAFKIAGARYLLMSLWKVPDGPTQELMQAFYEQWLDKGKSIPDAFRAAQAQLRVKYPNPLFWAGFVLVE